MSSKLWVIASALLLSSCKPGGVAADGYFFDGVDMPNTNRQITLVLYPTESVFLEEVSKRHIVRDGQVFGFSVINPDKNTCEVHIVDPAKRYKPEELGHEITHCLYGNFHKSQQ